MRAHEEEIAGAGAGLAAVGLGGRDYAARFRAETGIGFPLLVDEERRYIDTVAAVIGTGAAEIEARMKAKLGP